MQNPAVKRCQIEVEPSVGRKFEAIRARLGNPKKIVLATAAVLHVIKLVNERKLVLTNGDFEAAGKSN